MDFFNEFIVIPAIAVIVYFLAEVYKTLTSNKEAYLKLLPILCGGSGAVLAVVSYYAIPDYIPAENVLVAIAMGIVSGLAATGAHQVYKQLSTKNGNAQ